MKKIKQFFQDKITTVRQITRRYLNNPIQDMVSKTRKEEMHSYLGRYALVFTGHDAFELGCFGQIVEYNSLDNLYMVLELQADKLPEHIDREDPTTRMFWVGADDLIIIDNFEKPSKISKVRIAVNLAARLVYLGLGATIGIGTYLEYIA